MDDERLKNLGSILTKAPMRDTVDKKQEPLNVSIKRICLTKSVSSFASTSSCWESRILLISSSYLRMKLL